MGRWSTILKQYEGLSQEDHYCGAGRILLTRWRRIGPPLRVGTRIGATRRRILKKMHGHLLTRDSAPQDHRKVFAARLVRPQSHVSA